MVDGQAFESINNFIPLFNRGSKYNKLSYISEKGIKKTKQKIKVKVRY